MCSSLSGCGLLDMSTENVGIDDCGGPPADDAFVFVEPYERRPLLAGGGPVESGGLSPPASVERRFLFNAPRTPPKKMLASCSEQEGKSHGNPGDCDHYSHTYEKLQ